MDHLRMASWIAELMDNRFRVGHIGVGLDPLLNVLPIGGTTIALSLSLYILWIANQYQVPDGIRYRMIANIAIDFIIGLIPVAGWAFDAIFQANLRNLRLLHEWLAEQPIEGKVMQSKVIPAVN